MDAGSVVVVLAKSAETLPVACCRQHNVPTVFSPQFLHCLTTSLKNRDSLLFEQAQRCVRRIADLAKLSSVDTQTKVSDPGSRCP